LQKVNKNSFYHHAKWLKAALNRGNSSGADVVVIGKQGPAKKAFHFRAKMVKIAGSYLDISDNDETLLF
jgi:hypothetical protein